MLKPSARWIVFFILLATPSGGVAFDDVSSMDNYPTRQEYAELPRYCYLQRRTSSIPDITVQIGDLTPEIADEANSWSKVVGRRVWDRLHHYCGGLARMSRYWESVNRGIGGPGNLTRGQRISLERAIGEFEFMRQSMEEERSSLRQEWALHYAIAYVQLGDNNRAKERLIDAILYGGTFDVLYIELASILELEGNRAEAINILKIGLQKTGGSSSIRQALTNLNAK